MPLPFVFILMVRYISVPLKVDIDCFRREYDPDEIHVINDAIRQVFLTFAIRASSVLFFRIMRVLRIPNY